MYSHSNLSHSSAGSGRRLSTNNPFRPQQQNQVQNGLANYRASTHSLSTPTITEIKQTNNNNNRRNDPGSRLVKNRVSINTHSFEEWVTKNQELETLADEGEFKEDDLYSDDIYIKPQRPSKPFRTGSDSSTLTVNRMNKSNRRPNLLHSNSGGATTMSYPTKHSNNPFADALTISSTGSSHAPQRSTSPSMSPIYRNYSFEDDFVSPPPPVTRATGNGNGDLPPTYEEIVGPKLARNGSYPREKEDYDELVSSSRRKDATVRGSSRREHHHTTSNREHRSNSDGDRERYTSSSSRHHRHSSSRKDATGDREHRSSRHRSSSNKDGKSSLSRKDSVTAKSKNVDTIDKLDVTGFFGGGSFHHDGPFDACTPQRNKGKKDAPVAAFPVDGPNSTIKGTGPINIKSQQINYAFGFNNDDDGDKIYTTSSAPIASILRKPQGLPAPIVPPAPPAIAVGHPLYLNDKVAKSQATLATIGPDPSIIQFDSNTKQAPVHGSTTLGLGSSTFLDGAPASKTAIIDDANTNLGAGLGRKKSLVNRVKSIRRKG
ncbi:hypothetical protein PACTADRAFT_50029 [Pachysolen tannophilus NRRL Y-2460]|uniref:Pal1 cell morphology protein n=1 Tax=Pachysolen tannophilus NRRL Y-2460 TaxID=669874 RepID=A0A1E4TU02_PACTA|nr:hypothetical protein PACTADRAFT_50029 [Pachysolen tannophilus NRRL Y-2460]